MALQKPARTLLAPIASLFVSDSREGILLILIAVAAMVAANSSFDTAYHQLFHGALGFTPIAKLDTLHLWINDGLMAIFFFVVGLEVKREIAVGQLADASARRLPVAAAAAGMAVPALLFLLVVGGDDSLARGWAIPAATDIAFAMGIVGLLGNRVPPALRLFLLTVAIVDDVGAVAIIAIFYTAKVKLFWALAAAAVMAALIVCNRLKVERLWVYALGAAVLWLCVLHSGIHATIAGVLAALVLPLNKRDGSALLEPVEHALAPWNAFFIVPVFGFANAGVDLRGIGWEDLLAPLPLGIAVGLVAGKQIGVLCAVGLARATGFAPLPEGATWRQLWGVSILCGIGFTMSLFIGSMAFGADHALFEQVKLGVLGGTLLSVLLACAVLGPSSRPGNSA